MSVDPETTRIVRSWMDEGVTQLPDRVLDAVLDELPATPQHRITWWPGRLARVSASSMVVALAGAALVIAITLIGFGLVSVDSLGGPEADGATPSPTSPAMQLPSGPTRLEAGRYTLRDGFPADVTFEVPDGWEACVYSELEQGVCSRTEDLGSVGFLAVENVVVNPCGTLLRDPPAGRSIDAFLSAVADLAGFSVTEPVDVTRGELRGQQVTVTAPTDPPCQALHTWSLPRRTNGVHAGEVNVIEVFDIGGRLVAVVGASRPGVLSEQEAAEIRRMMDSVHIRP
jgi:hypothetical protein